ncbi:Transcription factor TBF1 [Spathaspora sp. JA1]|nr:Transcription factor TBF1 [Spathaspora sp. JA1]
MSDSFNNSDSNSNEVKQEESDINQLSSDFQGEEQQNITSSDHPEQQQEIVQSQPEGHREEELNDIDNLFHTSVEETNQEQAEVEEENTSESNKRNLDEETQDEESNKRPKVSDFNLEEPQDEHVQSETTQEQAPQEQDHQNDQFDSITEEHPPEETPQPNDPLNEKNDLEMIANELENATESNKDKTKAPENTTTLGGLTIPANSELLNTNTALAAYNALASEIPPIAALANANLHGLPLPIVAPEYLPPRIQLLINSLPTLDNLATQLLRIVASGPYQKIIDLASNPDTPAGATYRDLTSLFEFTKRLYSEEDPFLTVEHIAPGMWKEGEITPTMFRNREQSIESTLRKVNLATFLAATLGTIEVGFFYLNESFLDVFCPANNLELEHALSNMGIHNQSLQSGNLSIGDKVGKLLKPQATLYLELKTQAYISAIEAGERSREEILEDILPENFGEILLARRGTKALSTMESDFIERCRARKEILLNFEGNLGEEYEWFTFLKDLFEFVGKNVGFLIWGKRRRDRVDIPTTPHSDDILRRATATPEAQSKSQTPKPARTGRATAQSRGETAPTEQTQAYQSITSTLLPSEILERQNDLRVTPGISLTVQRRPWTRDEEKALRHALELKGPQWATILELFGNGGKISEALKNRSQIQLKDKARNWKMFFLKSGLPVPVYLQKVTGDLERDPKPRARGPRSKKTAAAPVPTVQAGPKDD